MEPTDLHFLKITDSVNIPVPLEIDTDYQVAAEISIIKEDKGSKQDGTYSYTYKAHFIGEAQLIKGETVIHGKKRGSLSQQLHHKVVGRGMQYDRFMNMLFRPEIFDMLEAEYDSHESRD